MKRILPLFLFFAYSLFSFAQKKPNSSAPSSQTNILQTPDNQSGPGPRCVSDVHLNQLVNKYPAYLQTIKQANRLLNDEVKRRVEQRLFPNTFPQASGPVVIPVVVHIVLPNPASVTDAQVQQQVDKLNLDFSGLNADSTNLRPMYPYSLRGHSKVRFVLAKQDSRQTGTTGIERRCSNTRFDGSERDPIKVTAEGGLDAWDPVNYLNIWVGNTSLPGVLGYGTYPYSVAGYVKPPQAFDGIVINNNAFGNNTSVYPANRGRTLVHEMGHFLGLFHIFQGGCSDSDFSAAAFDTGNTDDTPAQSAGTGYGVPGENACPSGSVSSGCAANPSSRLYQNYMDYTDDPCMSMFTANQVVRMETALDLFRPTLKTSAAANPAVTYSKDLQAVAAVGPNAGNPAYLPCNSTIGNLSFCSNQEIFYIAPSLVIRNMGASAINEVEVWYKIDNGPALLNKKLTIPPSIVSMDTLTITLQPIGLSNGVHDLRLFTHNPDNVADEHPSNDTLRLVIEMELPESQPVSEDFEAKAFPSTGWKTVNPDQDQYGWERSIAGHKSGQAAAFINFYDYDKPGSIDDLVTPAVDIAFADSIILGFERAYKEFDTSVDDFSDTLEILVSEDCGASYKTVWKNGGAGLASVPGSTGLFSWSPGDGEWKQATIDLRPFVSTSAHSIRVIFRAKNGYGQNLFLDDISLKAIVQPIRDAGIVRIDGPVRICNGNFLPSVVIVNLGEDTLRKLSVRYSVDGGPVNSYRWAGSLRKFQQATVAFDNILLSAGVHQIRFFIDSPNDLQDERASNDSTFARLFVFTEVNAPLTEGFDATTFPPLHWDSEATTSQFRWQRATHAAQGQPASAWVNNNSNTAHGSRQELLSPVIRVDKADSILVTFDLSHVSKDYPFTSSPSDTLQVLLTLDCGKTFTSVYKKWGPQLNTLNLAYPGNVTRDSIGFFPQSKSEWRSESINITGAVGNAATFQLIFRNINNNDNNLYLDNIAVKELILPDALKTAGYRVYPNPTSGVFYVRHYLPPMNLEGIQVVNASGQLLSILRYKGNAPAMIPVDLTNHAPGIYTVRLKYKERTVIEKIIKVN
jgi:hypothetical protein